MQHVPHDVYVYSEALLLGGMDRYAWIARGYVAALGCPLIAVSARRNSAPPETAQPKEVAEAQGPKAKPPAKREQAKDAKAAAGGHVPVFIGSGSRGARPAAASASTA
mgnify:CR=1 FL=1